MPDTQYRSPLPFTPDHLPDELFFSWLGRAHALNSLHRPRQTLATLLGSATTTPSADLPTKLDYFVKVAGDGAFKSVEQIVDRATLLPYFAFFLDPERRRQAIEAMSAGDGRALKTKLGLVANGFGASLLLRTCPECDAISLREHGCWSWTRTLNLPGVQVCPHHEVLLRGLVLQSRQSNRHALLLPIRSQDLHERPRKTPATAQSLRFARLSGELLLQTTSLGDPEIRCAAYRGILADLGFSKGGQVQWEKLARFIYDHHAGFEGMEHRLRLISSRMHPLRWVRDLCARPARALHPICHVLFIGATFGSVKTLMSHVIAPPVESERTGGASIASDRAGRRAWIEPDLLANAGLSCRAVAATSNVSVGTVVSRRRALGIGISARPKSLNAQLRASVEALLLRGESVTEVVEATGVSQSQVYRILASSTELKAGRSRSLSDLQTQAHRRDWIRLLTTRPSKSVTEIRTQSPALYSWLYRNDREWLVSNRPNSVAQHERTARARVDWAARDIQYARELSKHAMPIYSVTKDPRRTPSGLIRLIGPDASIRRNLQRLPKFALQLAESCEDELTFLDRRMLAASAALARQGRLDAPDWLVLRTSGIRPRNG